jgi:hypothetical protein
MKLRVLKDFAANYQIIFVCNLKNIYFKGVKNFVLFEAYENFFTTR